MRQPASSGRKDRRQNQNPQKQQKITAATAIKKTTFPTTIRQRPPADDAEPSCEPQKPSFNPTTSIENPFRANLYFFFAQASAFLPFPPAKNPPSKLPFNERNKMKILMKIIRFTGFLTNCTGILLGFTVFSRVIIMGFTGF